MSLLTAIVWGATRWPHPQREERRRGDECEDERLPFAHDEDHRHESAGALSRLSTCPAPASSCSTPSARASCPTPRSTATPGSSTLAQRRATPSAASTCRTCRRSGSATCCRCRAARPRPTPPSVVGRLRERSAGKDTTTGHWELVGIDHRGPMPTYPDGFPQSVLDAFARDDRAAACSATSPPRAPRSSSASASEHQRTGDWIVYTSADSRLPGRGARGDRPARRAVRGLPHRAPAADRASTPSGASSRGRSSASRAPTAHRQPPRLLARATRGRTT